MRTEKQKMLTGELYHAGDPEIQADQATAKVWMVRYYASLAASAAERRTILRELLAEVGEGAVIRPPFHCDFGYNIRIGSDVFLNFNCVILDVVAVTIGAGTPARSGDQKDGCRVRPSRIDRTERLDRRRGDHPSGSDHRR
jgi:maltose O-acetyltransferase